MFKSLRNRILLWFFFLTTMLVVILFPLNILHENSKNAVKQNLSKFNEIRVVLLLDQIAIGNFLADETTNENFFITGESSYLTTHYQLSKKINTYLSEIATDKNIFKTGLTQCIDTIKENYHHYNQLVDSMVYITYDRGFQQYGIIGELSAYSYQLEHFYKVNPSALNQLKLSTNTYCLRGDKASASQVLKAFEKLQPTSGNALEVMDEYAISFNRLQQLDAQLGLFGGEGLKSAYLQESENIRNSIEKTQAAINANQKVLISRLNIYYGGIAVLLILASLFFSVRTSQYLVKHLERLTNYISNLTANGLKTNMKIDFRDSTTEIKNIYQEFRNMMALIRVNEKMRDQALREAEENFKRYRELADMLPISIYETDDFGNLTYVNLAWQRTFGYNSQDVKQGLNLIEVLNNDSSSRVWESSQDSSEYVAIKKDGHRFPATLYSDDIKLNNRNIGHRGIIIDNTEKNQYIESLRKETIKAVTSDKHKSHFLANMSHELRTPMNSIIGFANLLSDEQLPMTQKKEFAAHIQTSSDFLLKLIDDIIDIAKIEAGEIKIKKASCNPGHLIKEILTGFEKAKSGQNKSIEFSATIPEENLSFYTDEFRLKQVLTNLISNAYKFTEQGKIDVSLRKKNQRMLEFMVEDSGIGMTREELNIIFERFKRTKTSEDKKISGTGLGLAISKNLIELLGGQMWVNSEKDMGTKFYFELPYVRVPKPVQEDNPVIDNNVFNYDWSGYRLLLAEDDSDNRKYIRQVLLRTNIELIETKNGREAIEAINFHDKIDIILMDLQMPVLNGYEATRIIKKHFPTIPIIVQTAMVMEEYKEKAFAYGCNDFITKPIQIEKFLAKINQFIELKKTIPVTQNITKDQSEKPDIQIKK